jgi:hypothetical protein
MSFVTIRVPTILIGETKGLLRAVRPESENEIASMKRLKRFQVIVPFFLVLLCIASINFVELPAAFRATPTRAAPVPTSTATRTPLAKPTAQLPPSPTVTNTPPPTASATPLPTPELAPTLPAGAQIWLYGPPDGSSYSRNSTVSFFWSWPYPLAEEQQFVLYLIGDGSEHRVGSVGKPNLGSAYSLRMLAQQLSEVESPVAWEVRLEDGSSAEALLVSERRALSFLED